MKKLFRIFLVIAFPWVVLFHADKPFAAIIAMVMQASLIAWIPASIWAWNSYPPTVPAKARQPKPAHEQNSRTTKRN